MRQRLPFRPIVGAFLLGAVAATATVTWLLVDRWDWSVLVAFLAAINLATFFAYLYDKSVACRESRLYRVPETVLHVLALAGGSPAAFAGQKLLHHKSSKRPFRAWFWAVVVLQIAALGLWVWYHR